MPDNTGVWVYAIVRELSGELNGELSTARLPETLGVAGERIRAVSEKGLTALVGTVDLGSFGEEALRRQLNDMASLENIARAHHRVIEAVAQLVPTAPARLATLYRDDAGVAAMLAKTHDRFEAVLSRVTGHAEWGLKIYAAGTSATDDMNVTEDEQNTPSQRPGTQYLLRRRAQLAATDNARETALASTQKVHTTLAQLATDSRQHAPQDPRLSGTYEWMVFNGAYLVANDMQSNFAAAVEALVSAYPQLRIDMTGPWPPYSFAGNED